MKTQNFDFMLAKKAKEDVLKTLWTSDKWGAQEKFDGSRYSCMDGALISRRTSVVTNEKVDKTKNVPHILKEVAQIFGGLSGLIVDGEIVHGQGWGSSMSAMGSLPDRALAWQKENGFVKYKIFDIIEHKGVELWKLPYIERHGYLLKLTNDLEENNVSVPSLVFGEEKKMKLYAKIIRRGGEGVILKNLEAAYEFDRSKNWIKVKKVQTYEVVITGYDDAKEWYAEPGQYGADGKMYKDGRKTKFFLNDWIGAIKFGLYDSKKKEVVEVGQCSGVDEEIRKAVSENKKKYIGKVMEITAQERMPTGGFRHPQFLRFRDDKDAKDCKEWLS